eukprot:scaffold116566_cov21-Tisochrysis_lutea.AAC.1
MHTSSSRPGPQRRRPSQQLCMHVRCHPEESITQDDCEVERKEGQGQHSGVVEGIDVIGLSCYPLSTSQDNYEVVRKVGRGKYSE